MYPMNHKHFYSNDTRKHLNHNTFDKGDDSMGHRRVPRSLCAYSILFARSICFDK